MVESRLEKNVWRFMWLKLSRSVNSAMIIKLRRFKPVTMLNGFLVSTIDRQVIYLQRWTTFA